MNILTQYFNTKHNTAPFSHIKNEDYLPAFQKGIALAKAEIDAIVNNSEKPTFENTIETLEFSGNTLDRISSIFFNLNSAETSDEMQKTSCNLLKFTVSLVSVMRLKMRCKISKKRFIVCSC
jgi:peptidyl-dipeptidase Dcp